MNQIKLPFERYLHIINKRITNYWVHNNHVFTLFQLRRNQTTKISFFKRKLSHTKSEKILRNDIILFDSFVPVIRLFTLWSLRKVALTFGIWYLCFRHSEYLFLLFSIKMTQVLIISTNESKMTFKSAHFHAWSAITHFCS